MGITGSSYKISTGPVESSQTVKGFEWLGKPSTGLSVTLRPESFENCSAIGKGKFGLVFLAKTLEGDRSSRYVAIKYISKQFIHETGSVDKLQNELDYLSKIDHPFAVHCFGAFDSPVCVAIVMEYCVGGELYHRMKQRVKFCVDEAKFYFLELVSVLRYLHEDMQIVYRDLKPENILLDYTGHVKLVDFGFTTLCSKTDTQLRDTCGTAMYISPEVVNKELHGYGVDYWALGCIVYEMLVGGAPFGDSDQLSKFEIFNNIIQKNATMPLFMNSDVKTVLKGLLNKNQKDRWGWDEIKASAWCKDVNWKDVDAKRLVPPFVPLNAAQQPGSTANFVKWELTLPTTTGNSEIQNYCRALRFPKGKVVTAPSSPPISSPASSRDLGGDGLKKAKSKRVSLAKESSGVGNLASSSSSSKLKKGRSSKASIATDNESDTPVDKEEVLEDQPPNLSLARSKSKAGGGGGGGKGKEKSRSNMGVK